jgi:hypothetical protein
MFPVCQLGHSVKCLFSIQNYGVKATFYRVSLWHFDVDRDEQFSTGDLDHIHTNTHPPLPYYQLSTKRRGYRVTVNQPS